METTYLVGVCAQGNTKRSGKTEISQLEVALLVDEQVLGLEIAMKDAMGVAVADSVAQLLHKLLDHGVAETQVATPAVHDTFGQRLASATLGDGQSLHVLLQIQVEVFEDEVQLVAVCMDNIEQTHNVWVVHFLEQGDFANGRRGDAFIFCFQTDLLEGDDAVVGGAEVTGLVHNTVCACGHVSMDRVRWLGWLSCA